MPFRIAIRRWTLQIMNSHEHCHWTEAFAEEMAEVKRRRPERLTPEEHLVGLAFSGGGIRSATFGLGVLERLREYGLLKKADYLSTVSGGGYIGAWLSANCQRHAGWLEPGAQWAESIKHLRRYSNYLSPTVGFFSADTWSMVTIWLRNTMLIQTTVILAIACALMVPRPLFELFERWPTAGAYRWLSIIMFVLGIVGIAGNQMRLATGRAAWLLLARNWLRGCLAAGALLAVALGYAMATDFAPFRGGEVSYPVAGPIAALLVLAGFCLQPLAVRLVALFYPAADRPAGINYTQNWVQMVVVVPLMVSGYLVAAILWGESTGAAGGADLAALDSYGQFFRQAWRYWPFPLSVVFVSIWLLSFCAIDSRNGRRAYVVALAAPFVAVPVLHALLCAVMWLLHGWAVNPVDGAWRAFVWAPPLVALSFVITIVVLIGMMGRQSTEEIREWWSRLGAWLGIYATAWMVIAVAAVYGPQWVDLAIEHHPWTSLTAAGGWFGTVVAGLFAGKSDATGGATQKSAFTSMKEIVAAVAPFLFIAGLLIGVAYALHQVVLINSGVDWTSARASAAGPPLAAAFLAVSLVVTAVCLAALLLMAARVDVNVFSLNAFYRNRLVRCYLGATRPPATRNPQNFTGFDGADDLPLADLAGNHAPSAGPLHLVNCALNLGGSSDLALHTRHSAAFTLTPLRCGSAYESRDQHGTAIELGYVATNTFGGLGGAPTLGQAISVSGAAASPNMGYHTSPVVAFLMTLFNVRLGWWFPNPSAAATGYSSPRFSLRYLVAELFGGAADKSRFVMVSDGGHLENLAVYELVRRRCRVIIASDAECDPQLHFDGLGTLIRMCQVDFAATIKIDVDQIRAAGSSSWSGGRFAVGRIIYGAGVPDGILIYLKASMTGQEDTAVLQYKATHPTFPHETTGDQFYGEDQFESYRQLGRDVALEAFAEVHSEPDMTVLAARLLTAQSARSAKSASAAVEVL
jgi:hypothetical protein